MGIAVALMEHWGEKDAYRILVGKPARKPLPRSWKDNIKIGWGGRHWMYLAAGSCEQGNEHSGSIKCWEIFE
jgi:hypothetical protein